MKLRCLFLLPGLMLPMGADAHTTTDRRSNSCGLVEVKGQGKIEFGSEGSTQSAIMKIDID